MTPNSAEKDTWALTINRYSGGWSWSTSPEGSMWEISGWAWTRRGALRSMRRARRSHELTQASRESWREAVEKTTPRFEAEWVHCVGCGGRILLMGDPSKTPESHQSRCLAPRVTWPTTVTPPAAGDAS